MDNIESFEETEDLQQCESVYLESGGGENSSINIESHAESMRYKKSETSQSRGPPINFLPGPAESWEESDQLKECESVYLETKTSKKKSKSKSQDEENIDLLLAKSQQDLDALMAKTAGSIDMLLEQTSENIDGMLLEKPAERKKSKKHKESSEATEDFGAVPERKKSKKHKDKEIDENVEEEGGDADKKKKKKKKSKSSATSRATSRGASPTPSLAPTEPEVLERSQTSEHTEPSAWSGSGVPMSYEKPYRVPVADRFKQITRDVNKLESTIHNLYEKEKLYKIRMLQQKYWHKPESKLYHSNLDYQENPYNSMMNYLDRKERGLEPEREPYRPNRPEFVSDYDIRTEESRKFNEREVMEKERVKRIMSAPSPRDVLYSTKKKDIINIDKLHSKQVQTDVSDVFIPHGPNQCVIPTRLSGESRGVSINKDVHTYMPVSQSVQTDMPVTLSCQTINTAPVDAYRSTSDADNNTLALAASMTRLATSRLEEARIEHEREEKLIHMNNKLMDSLQSLGRCVENLAVERTPVRVNQYNAMPANVAFYQEQLARMDEDTRKYKNQYLDQEPIYSPGNMSYHENPFESIKENRYTSIGNDDYKPTYKESKKVISDEDISTMLNEIKASRFRNRARTDEEFEEQESASGFLDKFDPNYKFDTSLLEDKDKEKAIQIVHSNYMRVRHAQLRASQRNAIHGH